MTHAASLDAMQFVRELAERIAALGLEMDLPYVAITADIGNPEPMRGPDGRPFAETLFRWLDPSLKYWEDRGFALRSPLVHATRGCAEPFYYRDGRFATWRHSEALDALNRAGAPDSFNVGAAIVSPAYLPRGVIGAVVWASPDATVDVKAVFDARAPELHATTLRLMAAYNEATAGETAVPVRLTRREIQCLKWAAAGKTDGEIAEIVQIALPTVRFHITNASRKLEVNGRSQAVHRAATLGYIGSLEAPRPPSP